jgi:hypothetical protein
LASNLITKNLSISLNNEGNNMNLVLKLSVFSLLVLSPAAHAIAIDGDLKDWIGAPTGSDNDWIPTDPSVKYTPDDQDGTLNNGYLNPGGGGQTYDAEAIYVKRDDLNFYVAVVTGRSPGSTEYPAGDLAFDFGNDGSYEYGVVVKTDSQTTDEYNGGIGIQGEVYRVSQWNVGLWGDNGAYAGIGQGTQAHPTTVRTGTQLGLAELVYGPALYNGALFTNTNRLGEFGGRHYLIEARISTSLFLSDPLFDPADLAVFTVHWTMGCANDSIAVDPPSNVPTPSVLPMLALGLAMLVGFRRNLDQSTSTVVF